jgi:hypothetical protein
MTMLFFSRKSKVFCIGCNKTGTTSLEEALKSFGYRMGSQKAGELLLRDYAERDFRKILKLCKTATAFQDIPFSLDHTYQAVDGEFPGSKFILTVRDTADQWFESLKRFHTKLVGKDRTPTKEDLQEYDYRYRGWLWECHQFVFGADASTLFDKELYINYYNRHNRVAIDYFKERPDDLLVLNVAEPAAMGSLCKFLNVQPEQRTFPHLNKTQSN